MEFEQHPWLLVPIVIVTVEAWSLVKGYVWPRLRDRLRPSERPSPNP